VPELALVPGELLIMTRRDTAQFPQSLQGIGIFSALSADAMAKLQKRSVWRHYEPDELIVDTSTRRTMSTSLRLEKRARRSTRCREPS